MVSGSISSGQQASDSSKYARPSNASFSGSTSSSSPYGQPIYETQFDAQGYNNFVGDQQKKLEENILKQREARQKQLDRDEALRNKQSQLREVKFKNFETDPFLAGRTQSVRKGVEVGRSQRLVSGANRDITDFIQKETERIRKQTEDAKGNFTKQVLVGYQSPESQVPEGFSSAQFARATSQAQSDLKLKEKNQPPQAVQLKGVETPSIISVKEPGKPLSQREIATLRSQGYTKPEIEEIARRQQRIDQTNSLSSSSTIKGIVEQGNVFASIASGLNKDAELGKEQDLLLQQIYGKDVVKKAELRASIVGGSPNIQQQAFESVLAESVRPKTANIQKLNDQRIKAENAVVALESDLKAKEDLVKRLEFTGGLVYDNAFKDYQKTYGKYQNAFGSYEKLSSQTNVASERLFPTPIIEKLQNVSLQRQEIIGNIGEQARKVRGLDTKDILGFGDVKQNLEIQRQAYQKAVKEGDLLGQVLFGITEPVREGGLAIIGTQEFLNRQDVQEELGFLPRTKEFAGQTPITDIGKGLAGVGLALNPLTPIGSDKTAEKILGVNITNLRKDIIESETQRFLEAPIGYTAGLASSLILFEGVGRGIGKTGEIIGRSKIGQDLLKTQILTKTNIGVKVRFLSKGSDVKESIARGFPVQRFKLIGFAESDTVKVNRFTNFAKKIGFEPKVIKSSTKIDLSFKPFGETMDLQKIGVQIPKGSGFDVITTSGKKLRFSNVDELFKAKELMGLDVYEVSGRIGGKPYVSFIGAEANVPSVKIVDEFAKSRLKVLQDVFAVDSKGNYLGVFKNQEFFPVRKTELKFNVKNLYEDIPVKEFKSPPRNIKGGIEQELKKLPNYKEKIFDEIPSRIEIGSKPTTGKVRATIIDEGGKTYGKATQKYSVVEFEKGIRSITKYDTEINLSLIPEKQIKKIYPKTTKITPKTSMSEIQELKETLLGEMKNKSFAKTITTQDTITKTLKGSTGITQAISKEIGKGINIPKSSRTVFARPSIGYAVTDSQRQVTQELDDLEEIYYASEKFGSPTRPSYAYSTPTKSESRLYFKEPIKTQTDMLSKQISKSMTKGLEKELSKGLEKEITKPIYKPLEKPLEKELSKSLEKSLEKQMTKPLTKTLSKPLTKTFLKPIIKIPIKTPIRIILPKNEPLDKILTKKQTNKAYDIFVRKKGKLELVSKALPRNLALLKGLSIADIGTQRTTVLKEAGFTKQKDINLPRQLLKKFRLPKQKSSLNKLGKFVLIEKSKYAISSFEEKKGIPGEATRLRKLGIIGNKKRNLILNL